MHFVGCWIENFLPSPELIHWNLSLLSRISEIDQFGNNELRRRRSSWILYAARVHLRMQIEASAI